MARTYSILNVPFSEKNCAISEPPSKLSKGWRLRNGVSVAEDWPKNAKLPMDAGLGGNAVKEAIYNQFGVLAVAQRLKEALEASLVGEVEYLPFTLVNAKGKPLEGSFWVVNVLEVVDCVDRQRTDGSASGARPGGYSEIRMLVLDDERIPKKPNAFRIEPRPEILVVRDDLRSAIEAGKFSGVRFLELGVEIDIF